jgi:hypothetical protein
MCPGHPEVAVYQYSVRPNASVNPDGDAAESLLATRTEVAATRHGA